MSRNFSPFQITWEFSLCFSGVRVAQSLVFCIVFCRSLFILFLLAIVLSVLDLWLWITPLAFSQFSVLTRFSKSLGFKTPTDTLGNRYRTKFLNCLVLPSQKGCLLVLNTQLSHRTWCNLVPRLWRMSCFLQVKDYLEKLLMSNNLLGHWWSFEWLNILTLFIEYSLDHPSAIFTLIGPSQCHLYTHWTIPVPSLHSLDHPSAFFTLIGPSQCHLYTHWTISVPSLHSLDHPSAIFTLIGPSQCHLYTHWTIPVPSLHSLDHPSAIFTLIGPSQCHLYTHWTIPVPSLHSLDHPSAIFTLIEPSQCHLYTHWTIPVPSLHSLDHPNAIFTLIGPSQCHLYT